MAIKKILADQTYVVETTKEIIYTPQELTDEQKAQAAVNVGLPTLTADDAGKFLRVSAEGKYVVEAVPSAEEAEF